MKKEAIVTTIYAVFLLIGGIIGYFVAQSLMSLIMGVSTAAITGIAAWGMFRNCYYSKILAMIMGGLLLVFFSYRFVLTMKVFPAGIMLMLSVALLVVLFTGKKCAGKCST